MEYVLSLASDSRNRKQRTLTSHSGREFSARPDLLP
ncbi:protein of unknown function [Burkholderia multivorans]